VTGTTLKLWDGREIPRLGMGGWPIAGPFYAGDLQLGYGAPIEDRDAVALLRATADAGVKFFDTAAVYGAGHSEELFGEAFGNRDDIVIATKFGPTFDERTRQATGQDLSPDFPRTDIEASLRRLRRERIDLYQLHVNSAPIPEALAIFDTLDALVAEGKIGAYGWSTDFPANVEAAGGRPSFVAVQHALNVFFAASALMPVIERHGLISINRSPLAMGVLGGGLGPSAELPEGDVRRNNFEWLDYFKDGKVVPSYLDQLGAVRELLQTGGRSLAQGALGWLWTRYPRTLPIPGFRTRAHAEDCIGALGFGPLPQATFDEIERLISRPPEGPARER
jgi:aryl-alcohol dehydrogenase-like predicted oxidoreductase